MILNIEVIDAGTCCNSGAISVTLPTRYKEMFLYFLSIFIAAGIVTWGPKSPPMTSNAIVRLGKVINLFVNYFNAFVVTISCYIVT